MDPGPRHRRGSAARPFVRVGFAVLVVGLAGVHCWSCRRPCRWLVGDRGVRRGRARDGPRLLAAVADRAARSVAARLRARRPPACSCPTSLGTALGTGRRRGARRGRPPRRTERWVGLAAGVRRRRRRRRSSALAPAGRLRPPSTASPACRHRDGRSPPPAVDRAARRRAVDFAPAARHAPMPPGPASDQWRSPDRCQPRSCARRSARSPTSRSRESSSTTSRRCSRTRPPTRRRST